VKGIKSRVWQNKTPKDIDCKIMAPTPNLTLGTGNLTNNTNPWNEVDIISDIKCMETLAKEKKKCDKKLLEELEKIKPAPKGFRWAITKCPNDFRKDCFYLEVDL
jgi:hypothetical protein